MDQTSRSPGLTKDEVRRIYTQYGALVLRRCQRLNRSESDAQELFQHVFEKLLTRGARFREADCELAFLYAMTRRCALDHFRARTRWRAFLDALAASSHNSAQPPAPVALKQSFDAALARLSLRDRVVILGIADGATQVLLAEEVGLTRQSVNRIVKNFRLLVEEQGFHGESNVE